MSVFWWINVKLVYVNTFCGLLLNINLFIQFAAFETYYFKHMVDGVKKGGDNRLSG